MKILNRLILKKNARTIEYIKTEQYKKGTIIKYLIIVGIFI